MPKTELFLNHPLMNAAGMLGFAPDYKSTIDFSDFGAFVTNPISREPRFPSRGERFIPFPGGFLLHTGYPNPGLRTIIRKKSPLWARSPIPIIIHLLVQDAYSLERMIRDLEGIEGVIGVEIGLEPGIDPDFARSLIRTAIGELAIIIQLPFEYNPALIDSLSMIEINAFSLAPPRGSLAGYDGTLISGRLYGQGYFPQTLGKIRDLVEIGPPVIGGGGVYSQKDVDSILDLGAIAVQLDSVLWRGDFKIHDLS